jgi:hypothetical protein
MIGPQTRGKHKVMDFQRTFGTSDLNSVNRQFWITIALTLVWPVVLTACSESKSDRCNRLISISNRTSQTVQKLPAENLQPADRFTKAADLLESAAQEMQDLKLSDSKLLDLQQQLSTLYRQDSTHNRTLAQSQNAKAVRTAAEQIQTNSIAHKKLVQAVNIYCQAPDV